VSLTTEEIERVLTRRTRWIVPVFEDLFQAHNGAAVTRACECFGIQELHAISNENPFTIDPGVVAGADRFVDIRRWADPDTENTEACVASLRARGYRILATSLRPGCVALPEVSIERPVALMFGTELKGLSDVGHELADAFVRIPMFGFTQSFNISVSTALSLAHLTRRLRATDLPWGLADDELDRLRAEWAKKSL